MEVLPRSADGPVSGGCLLTINLTAGRVEPWSAAATMTSPNIAILLGTYNGARFLRAQLRSIETQTVAGWAGARLTLYVSDDGSSDSTLAIIEEFSRSSVVNVVVGARPDEGFCGELSHLI